MKIRLKIKSKNADKKRNSNEKSGRNNAFGNAPSDMIRA
jgi:hypothetical protein